MGIQSFQVVVVGGGPAGSAVAKTLCDLGVSRVLLLEGKDYKSARVGECIPPETRLLLDELGVWQQFLAQKHAPALGSCSSWGSEALGHNDFLFNPHGHGRHLNRRRFDGLLAGAAEAAGAELRLRTRCVAVRRQVGKGQGDGLELDLIGAAGKETIRCRFVIDAAGSSSFLARRLGAEQLLHDRLTVVVAFFPSSRDEGSRLTWLEAVEYGWWYAAQLPSEQAVMAVASDGQTVQDLALHRAESFHAHLAQTRHLASSFAACRARAESFQIRSAPSFVLDRAWGRDWLAVGDAASSYDPISSQGIHKALHDGLAAARAVAGYWAGDGEALRAYGVGIRDRFDEYLAVRNHLYDQERRWPDGLFWQRRRSRRGPEPRPRNAAA